MIILAFTLLFLLKAVFVKLLALRVCVHVHLTFSRLSKRYLTSSGSHCASLQEKPTCCSRMQVGYEECLGTKPAASFPSALKTGRVGSLPAAQETPSVGKCLLG